MFNSHSKHLFFSFISLSILISCHQVASNNKKVFYYNESTGIATLDPAFAKNQSIMWAIHQVYNTLVEIDSTLQIKPSLAYKWQVSEDRKTYTFFLRQNIYFHTNECFGKNKTRLLTAQDVVYSFNRIIDKKTASSGAWIFNNRVDSLQPFAALNDSVFQLKLKQPFNPILGILSMQYCSIIAKEAVDFYGSTFRRNPVGTGAFKFHLWEEGQALVLHKNEQYWEKDDSGKKLPYLDAIQVSFYDNKATEFLQFTQKKLSFVNDIDPSFKDEVLTKKGELRPSWEQKIQLNKHPYLNTEYFGILVDGTNPLVQNSPLKFKALRQAINYAINREQLITYMRNNIGYAATAGFCPSGLPSKNAELVKGYSYNPQKARELLVQNGFANGTPTIKLLTIPIYADIASFAAKQCEDVGIKVVVETVQKSLLLEQTAKSKALFFRGSWIADYPDAENYMSVFYSKNPAPPNYTRFSNKTFDDLYNEALQQTNDSIRYSLYRKMDELIVQEAPIVPVWYDMVIHLVHKNVQQFKPNALNLLELRKVQLQ
jgi:peptide/nickel transport system substrate-binding protein